MHGQVFLLLGIPDVVPTERGAAISVRVDPRQPVCVVRIPGNPPDLWVVVHGIVIRACAYVPRQPIYRTKRICNCAARLDSTGSHSMSRQRRGADTFHGCKIHTERSTLPS